MNIEVHVSFELWFSVNICPGVGLPDHLAALFLIFIKYLLNISFVFGTGLSLGAVAMNLSVYEAYEGQVQRAGVANGSKHKDFS